MPKNFMQKDDLQELITKYLNDECSPHEIYILNEWYNSFDKNQNPVDLLSELQQQQLKQRLKQRIRNKIALAKSPPVKLLKGNNKSININYFLSAIAAMLLLVLGVLFFKNDKVVRSLSSEIVAYNKTKNIKKYILDDGSTVWLNPESKIVYPKKFPLAERKIKLSGEAFFEVTPDAERPFLIYSDDIVTRVWGTSFLVKANKGHPEEVSVLTGKVSVRLQQQKEDSEIMLMPDEKVTFLKASNVLKKEGEQNFEMHKWRKTTLSFDNVPLKDVVNTLNKKFGVNISLQNTTLLNYTLKADFTDQSLPSILEMLMKSLAITYEINEEKIILSNQL